MKRIALAFTALAAFISFSCTDFQPERNQLKKEFISVSLTGAQGSLTALSLLAKGFESARMDPSDSIICWSLLKRTVTRHANLVSELTSLVDLVERGNTMQFLFRDLHHFPHNSIHVWQT